MLSEVRSFFSPELLNRFDETVVFQRLARRDVAAICQLLMAETVSRAAERGLDVRVAPPLMEHIIEEGYSDEYGARPLRQVRTGGRAGVRACRRRVRVLTASG